MLNHLPQLLTPIFKPAQLINKPPDIWHCDKYWQAEFSRQFFVANQASVGRGQADFFSPTAAPDFFGLVCDVKITVLGYASFDWHSLKPVWFAGGG